MGLVNRRFYQDSSLSTLRALYITLVRPDLKYTAQLWNPYTHCDVNKLEAVQRFALRVIFHQWDSTYKDLLNIVKIQKVQERRLNLKLTLVYKMRMVFVTSQPVFLFCTGCIQQDCMAERHTMLCPHACTNYYRIRGNFRTGFIYMHFSYPLSIFKLC